MIKKYLFIVLFLASQLAYCQQLEWERYYWLGGRDIAAEIEWAAQDNNFLLSGVSDFNDQFWWAGVMFNCQIDEVGDTVDLLNYNGEYAGGITSMSPSNGGFIGYTLLYDSTSWTEYHYFIHIGNKGGIQWITEFNEGTNSWIRDGFIALSDGGALLAGDRGAFEHDCFAVRVDKDGNILWNKDFYVPGYQQVYGLNALQDGSFAITGGDGRPFVMKIDKDGNMLDFDTLADTGGGNFQMQQTPDGKYLGVYSNFTQRFLFLSDTNFNFEWKKQYNVGKPILLDNGTIYVPGTEHLAIHSLGSGVEVWRHDLVSTDGTFRYFDEAFNDSNEVVITVSFDPDTSPDPLDREIYLAKFSGVGKPLPLSSNCETPPVIYWISAALQNGTVTMTDQSEAFLTYNTEYAHHWILQDGREFYDTMPSFTFDQTAFPDTFWVALVIYDGIFCSDTMVINVYTNEILPNYVGIEEKVQPAPERIGSLAVYPNPAQTSFTVQAETSLLTHGSGRNILFIYNAVGQVQESFVVSSGNAGRMEVDASHYPQGMYYLLLRNEEGVLGKGKVIVE